MTRKTSRPLRPPTDLTEEDMTELDGEEQPEPDPPRLHCELESRWDTTGENGVDSLAAAYLDRATGNADPPRGRNSIIDVLSHLR
jgi:hypothetical protein